MINFHREKLDNGLICIYNEDFSTPFVALNILYKVGSKHENESRTGFAHLFEHLMFGGTPNIPDYDTHVQEAGGENNAFTTNDYTNYYITIPASNIETALWLEADRMSGLEFSEKSLNVQKQVVIEEFKQRYLNAPYGDVWLKLRPLAYKTHPYKWATIGKSTEDINTATLDEVKDFFHRFYCPNNAILTISGGIKAEEASILVKKWFGFIPSADYAKPYIPEEPIQNKAERLVVRNKEIPADAIYKVWHMGGRNSHNFYVCDIISDLMSNGNSSRIYKNLIKGKSSFSSIDAFVMGEVDPSLFVISGKVSDGVSIEKAENDIQEEIDKFIQEEIDEREIQKVINKTEARLAYSEIGYQNKALNLAIAEMHGDVNMVNTEYQKYEAVSIQDIKSTAKELFREENSATLLYLKK